MEQLGRELPPRGRRVVLELGGLKIKALRKLVRFLYTAELEATQEEVQEVLAAARRLRVTELESLQLQGGRLVRPGPQRQLNRSCLRSLQHSSPVVAGGRAEPGGAGVPPGSAGVPPQGQPWSPGTTHPSPGPVGRVKLRKLDSGGCWEVVRERQPPTAPGAVAAGNEGMTGRQPPAGAGAVRGAGRRSPPRAAGRKQGQVPPPPQQGCAQAMPLRVPPGDPDEEIDVGTVEPCLPPSAVCVRPCPSPELDEEVDVLT
ncbi:BTB/POZ domain-containing protein 18 isoform 2-T2 [Chlamydotis macqueenii]